MSARRPRLSLEPLEDRTTPTVAQSFNAATGVLTLTFQNGGDQAQIGMSATQGVRFSGSGLAAGFQTGVTAIVVQDTIGNAGQALVVQDDAGAPQLTLSGLFSISGIEAVTFANPTNAVRANGGLTIAGAQTVGQSNASTQIGGTGAISITASGTGDAIGTAASPLRVAGNAQLFTSNTTAGNGNQFFNLGAIANFVNVQSVNAGTGTVTLFRGNFFGQGDNYGDNTTFNLGVNGSMGVGNDTIGGLTGTGLVAAATAGATTLTVGGGNTSSSFGGTIKDTDPVASVGTAGPLALQKIGTGTFTLAGTNTYTGTTTVTGGTLLVNGSIANGPATPDVTVTTGGAVGGTGAAPVSVQVNANSALLPGTTTATAVLPTGSVGFQPGGVFGVKIAGAGAGQFDAINVTGTVAIGGANLFIPAGAAALPPGASIAIIQNDGADAITGRFANEQNGRVTGQNGVTYIVNYAGGDGNDVTLTAVPAPPAPPPAPPAPPPPFYSGVSTVPSGNSVLVTVTGAGVSGGAQTLALPAGSLAFFIDANGDGKGDVVLVLDGNIFVFDGATGRFLLAFADFNGDGQKELRMF